MYCNDECCSGDGDALLMIRQREEEEEWMERGSLPLYLVASYSAVTTVDLLSRHFFFSFGVARVSILDYWHRTVLM
jgi:hypothetical protein